MEIHPLILLAIPIAVSFAALQAIPLLEMLSRFVFRIASMGLPEEDKALWKHESLDYLLQQILGDRFKKQIPLGFVMFNAVNRALNLLIEAPALRRQYRSIGLSDEEMEVRVTVLGGPQLTTIPVIGSLWANAPIPLPSADTWSADDFEEGIEVTTELTQQREGVFALRVVGNSFLDGCLQEGDLVLVEPIREWKDGELLLVWLKEAELTSVKRTWAEGSSVRLESLDSQKSLTLPLSDIEIQGKVLFRLGVFF